jgi:hypothetical protein
MKQVLELQAVAAASAEMLANRAVEKDAPRASLLARAFHRER